ncbi:hypothetical protein GCM10020369_06780 [Cryptosporangium minutisporangium]|uniref:Uncharacterized protein n=1 Tax=Cryptosporangium minutisporangium TaxID=113569 RepID=A0ABP6SR88_9ACTN
MRYAQLPEFIELVATTDVDVECVVECDVVRRTAQAPRQVYFKTYPGGTLARRLPPPPSTDADPAAA